MNADDLLSTARNIIRQIEYCFVITQNDSGSPNARVMEPFAPENDWTIWLGTRPESRKIHEMLKNPRITLAYYYPSDTAYVTVQGVGHLETDINLRRKYWNETWRSFFPDGPEGDDYTLIRFEPDRIELLDFAQQITPEPFGLQPAVLVRTEDGWIVEVV